MRKKLQEKKKQWMEWLTGLFAKGKELIKTVREHMAELSREQELEERKIQALKRMIRYAGELLLVLMVREAVVVCSRFLFLTGKEEKWEELYWKMAPSICRLNSGFRNFINSILKGRFAPV